MRLLVFGVLVACPDPATAPNMPIDADGDGVFAPVDCADDDPERYPGRAEVVGDGVDQDCDGEDACHLDGDRDGFGSTLVLPGPLGCDSGPVAPTSDDCDDDDPTVYPGAFELRGDGVDQDCDGQDV